MNTNNALRILGALAIVGIIGLALWKGTSIPKSDTPSPSASEQVSPLASASATPLPLTYEKAPIGWATYASASMGVAISYPKDWAPASCGPACVGWQLPQQPGQFLIGLSTSTSTLDAILQEAKQYAIDQQVVTVAGIRWTKVTLRHPQTGQLFTSHFTAKGTTVYEVSTATADAAILQRYGQMLNSFRFTK